ncbi:hypothetical protein Z043_122164 [Scleropages formosus]|uniref:Histone H2A/H2B/H3 domain-containing protein n=1 Tax=Scleropages formosus TaxID=113540 RepID=A0A0P7WFE2_SCLFO|nr:hypothetical protein Z043_122164 [Scleropages formosus]
MKDFRVQELPLARIKKIMKLDEDVKAAQIFITELTLRAWIHTEDNKRRTLQVNPPRAGVSTYPHSGVLRNDIAMAITKFDQFDFLIDIVPRDELKPPKRQVSGGRASLIGCIAGTFSRLSVGGEGLWGLQQEVEAQYPHRQPEGAVNILDWKLIRDGQSFQSDVCSVRLPMATASNRHGK